MSLHPLRNYSDTVLATLKRSIPSSPPNPSEADRRIIEQTCEHLQKAKFGELTERPGHLESAYQTSRQLTEFVPYMWKQAPFTRDTANALMVASEFTDLPKGTLYQLKAAFERRRPEVQGRAHDAHVAYEAYMRDVDTCSQSSSEVEDAMEETLDEAMRQCDAAEQLVIKCEQLTNELLRSADTLRQAVKSAQSTQESSSPVDQRTHSSSASSV